MRCAKGIKSVVWRKIEGSVSSNHIPLFDVTCVCVEYVYILPWMCECMLLTCITVSIFSFRKYVTLLVSAIVALVLAVAAYQYVLWMDKADIRRSSAWLTEFYEKNAPEVGTALVLC